MIRDINFPGRYTDVHQGLLEHVVAQIFPGQNIVHDSRKSTKITNPSTGHLFEVDVWIPSLNLGFEFQDIYHYITTWYSSIPLDSVKQKDQIKRDKVAQRGHTLVVVPCWWDGSKQSLISTIQVVRPDLLSDCENDGVPIPLNPTPRFFSPSVVPDIGELMYASSPPYLSITTDSISPSNPWWMGEKYDGIRACWNPYQNHLYSKSGVVIELLPSFEQQLMKSSSFLDCEVWFGRGCFLDSQKLIAASLDNWPFLRAVVFDNASPELNKEEFELRYTSLFDQCKYDHPFVIIASRLKSESKKIVGERVGQIMESGGEGVILRRARSLYVHGRSDYLLKLKAARADREALVVSVNYNDLSFELQLPDGIIFSTPPQNRNVFEELPIRGDVVTFTCENYSRKFMPVNAEILRIRKDVTWRDVIRDYVAERSRSLDLNESSQKGSKFTEKESGLMKEQKTQKLKEKLMSTASKLNVDPNLPSTWYSLFASIMKIKEIAHMVNKFKGGYPKLIMHLFPDIGLKESEFPSLRKYWTNINNQRQLFLEFAQHNHFDPLVPENWYSVKSDSLKSFEGARSVLQFYGNGHVNALIHLFPEIGLKQHLFSIKPRGYWEDFENQRNFFILFAQQKGFDPMVASNWKNVSGDEIRSQQGSSSLLGHFSGSVQKALLHVFPNIGLSKNIFSNSDETLDQREFLVNFAKEKNLDPFIADSWYSVRASHFSSTKNGRTFLSSVQGKFKQALYNAFPNISFDNSMFRPDTLKTVHDQKIFLETFARQKGFDHLLPENWYAVSANQIRSRKGGDQFLAQYDGSHIKAIMNVFPDIGLVKDRFPKSYKFWANEDNQRELFLSFAKGRKFDPKVPDYWYNHIGDFVKVQKKSGSVLNYYSNNAAAALFHLFPNIGLDKSKLRL